MGQSPDGIADDDSAVVEDLLESDGRVSTLTCGEKRFAAHIDGIQGSEEFAGRAGFVGSSNQQGIECPAGIAPVEEMRARITGR